MVIRLEVFFQEVLNRHRCHVKYCTKILKRNDKQVTGPYNHEVCGCVVEVTRLRARTRSASFLILVSTVYKNIYKALTPLKVLELLGLLTGSAQALLRHW